MVNDHTASIFYPEVGWPAPPEIIHAGVADAVQQIPVDLPDLLSLCQGLEERKQHFLHQIFRILTPAYAHVGKAEKPMLALLYDVFKSVYVRISAKSHFDELAR